MLNSGFSFMEPKSTLLTHLDYSLWATSKLLDAASRLSPEQLNRDLQVSHISLLGTLQHIYYADRIWLARLEGRQIDFADPSIFNTFIRHNWQSFNQDVMLSVVRDCNNFVMSKEIIHQVFGSHTFFYNTTEHFLQHQAQLTPHITKWLVVGNTWPICTHRSEMGLTGFSALTRRPDFAHLSFYGTPWGFIKENDTVCTANDFVDDQYVQWQQLSNELFQLK
jgi:hypothetical protein